MKSNLLVFSLALLAAAGPLLNGSWDLWAQSVVMLAGLAAGSLWLCGRLLAGSVPLPPSRLLAWTACLAAGGGLSAYAGPLTAYSVPVWHVWLAALGAMLAVSVLPERARGRLNQAIRIGAWLLVLWAIYQHFSPAGPQRPYAGLLNQNIFAGAILLFLPLAAASGDWLLGAALIACLYWTHSVGAWLGLAAALLILAPRRGVLWALAGAGAGAVGCALLFSKLGAADFLDRWRWWQAAAHMSLARPWLGFGPGSYAYVSPAYAAPASGLGTLFAHQHLLETAAEQGWPFLLVWLAGLAAILRRAPAAKIAGPLAVLVLSLWDYSLSIPAVLWLFSCSAALALPTSGRLAKVGPRWRVPACVAVLCLGAWAGTSLWQRWQADRLRSRAEAMVRASGPVPAALDLLGRSIRLCDHPEAERFAGLLEAALARQRVEPGRLLAAAVDLERSAAQDPYRASTWSLLEGLYRELGREDLARFARQRGAVHIGIIAPFEKSAP